MSERPDHFTASRAVDRAVARDLSVADLIQAVEMRKASLGVAGALDLYDAWIEHNADNPLIYAVLFNYAVLLTDSGDLDRARGQLERAIILNPAFIPAYINLGRVYERMGATGLAVLQWSNAVDRLSAVNGAAISHKTTALNQMARVLEGGGQDDAAESMLRQSLELDPQQREPLQHLAALRQRQCEWPVVAPWERVTGDLQMKGMSPLSLAAYTDDPMLQLAGAWNYNLRDVGPPAGPTGVHPLAVQGGSKRLRIGYLSSDLRHHAIGFLTAELYALHDRDQVEVFAYYCGPDLPDPLQARIKADVDHWVAINTLDDAAAAKRIADDGIQILVDVNGYTRDGRIKLLAQRPAPVIVNWLGFPGTMASPYHHYIVADDWIIPEDQEIYYSEKVLRLPCYQPNDRKRKVASRQPTRTEMGLPEDGVVFCCFNGTHKITRFTFERWLRILEGVPGSVLWLLSGAETSHVALRKIAQARGLDPARLVFAGKMANPDHLARYPLADLFLDTTPYGAHTTASDALWMGVPVLTLSGRSFASRVCGSLVRGAGLEDLICASPDDYVARAIELGQDAALRQGYRDRLAANRETCVLFDTPLLVRGLEALYRQMWADFEAGALPQPDLTNLDVYLEVGAAQNHDEIEVQAIEDYTGWWRGKLAERHAYRPIPFDHRLWPAPEHGAPEPAGSERAAAPAKPRRSRKAPIEGQ
ncbi:MAG: glycosyl transferase [Caulobacteraceae bacterium]|nr:glycosyl transferase [Caulobacteraceae bacterium]